MLFRPTGRPVAEHSNRSARTTGRK
jgi:hypothetical protein